jgi:hypothetical protein
MRRFLSVLIVCAAVASPLAAQTHPDLSGKWSLDPKSVPAGMPAGSTVVVTLKQDEKTINVDMVANTPMGEQKRSTSVNLDGTPTKNTLSTPAGSLELTSTAAWEGPVLTVMTSADLQGYAMVQMDKWSLDADKKTLELETTVSVAGQKTTSKLSFIKQ